MASKKVALALAMSLIGGTTAGSAQTAPSSAAPVGVERVGASLDNGNALNRTEWILIAISLAVIIFGIIEFSSDQNNSNSP